jgi:hypothetical protein
MSFEEIFEESCRARHATTTGYKRRDGRILPQLKGKEKRDRIAEKANNPMIREMQRGILDFAGQYIQAALLTGEPSAAIKPFALALAERAVAYPRKEEVVGLQELVHTEDWGYDNILQFEPEQAQNRVGQWRRQFLESNWKYGVAATSLGSLSLPILRILRIMKMAKA